MSTIELNALTLPKFSKRLQKALSDHFKQNVSMSDAYMFLAKAAGKKDLHELQKYISKNENDLTEDEKFFLASDVNSLQYVSSGLHMLEDLREIKAKRLIKDLENYNKDKSGLLNLISIVCEDYLCIHIQGISIKNNKNEAIALYFKTMNSNESINEQLNELNHTDKDKEFVNYLNKKYFHKDEDQNIYFGSTIKKHLNLQNGDAYLAYLNKNMGFVMHLPEIGNSIVRYVIVDDFFFGKNKISYEFNSKTWTDISIVKTNKMYNSIGEAFANNEDNQIILQACESENDKKIYCYFYIYIRDDKLKLTTIDDNIFEVDFDITKQISYYEGCMAYRKFHLKAEDNPYFINDLDHKAWSQGFFSEFNKDFKKEK